MRGYSVQWTKQNHPKDKPCFMVAGLDRETAIELYELNVHAMQPCVMLDEKGNETAVYDGQ